MKLSILGIGGSLDRLSLTLLFWNLSVIYLSEKKSLITRIFRNWFHASHSSKIYRGNVVGIKYECLMNVYTRFWTYAIQDEKAAAGGVP